MLAVIEKAREIVDWETPSVRATSWAVTWAPVLGVALLAIVLPVSQEIQSSPVQYYSVQPAGSFAQNFGN
jgi:hypothetical protein